MYVDKNTVFSSGEDLSAGGVSAAIDLYPGYSGGDRPFIVAIASGYDGSDPMDIQLESAPDASFAQGRVVASFPLRAKDLATGGEVLAVSLPRNVERYVRLKYVVNGSINALTMSAMLVLNI